ncbi:MAG: DUF308 domain-containing protein [Bacilli bacterium]|nr:DUF308 domain-containing protein [Bacilli bacterium]
MRNDLIINPEKKKKSPLLISILTLVLGCMLLTNNNKVVVWSCYIIGAIALIIGLFNVFSKYITKKEGNVSFGIYAIVVAVLLFILAGTIEVTLRMIIGIWLILNGLSKLALAFKVKEKFVPFLVLSIILILAGMYCILVSNIFLVVVGAFLIASATIDLYNYFFN